MYGSEECFRRSLKLYTINGIYKTKEQNFQAEMTDLENKVFFLA